MFSGIRSMLFGYSETADTNEQGDNQETGALNESKIDTSALLEQTLNAATTKFTEQLLPQSASIEQLQSSSRQLLPTLNEQHEEDEYKRKLKEGCEAKVGPGEDANDDDDDDDECFNDDSWEMLDLIEKPKASTSGLNSTVQLVESAAVGEGKISGILKQMNSGQGGGQAASSNDDTANSLTRQKPKVSFETPDLVKGKKKIELTTPKGKDSKNCSKNKKGRNKKSKIHDVVIAEQHKQSCEVANGAPNSGLINEEFGSPSKNGLVDETSSKSVEATCFASAATKAPVLNYAAALSMKLGKKNEDKSEIKDKQVMDIAQVETTKDVSLAPGAQDCKLGTQSSGAIKRNRPVSTSSWSSSDEIDIIPNGFTNDLTAGEQVSGCANGDDNESLLSSGFSDCDYGYNCVNNYLMRPKKSHNKRRRQSSTSNSLIASMTKQGGEREKVAPTQTKGKEQKSSDSKSGSKFVSSLKHTKPKKKKLLVESFTKPKLSYQIDSSEQVATSDSSKIQEEQSEGLQAIPNVKVDESPVIVADDSMQTPLALANDSSDFVVDMDESWFVTPPPCFTGSNKLDKARSKEAARENALIEHPSIYIASTSQQFQQTEASAVTSNNQQKQQKKKSKKVSEPNVGETSSKTIEVGRKQVEPVSQSSDSKVVVVVVDRKQNELKKSKSKQTQKVDAKKEAWENKFIVTNWNYDDEQDDVVDDFDNLFAPEISQPKKEKKQQKFKAKKQVAREQQDFSLHEEDSVGYESDFSNACPALVGITDQVSDDLSIELNDPVTEQLMSKTCTDTKATVDIDTKPTSEKKPPVQVRPIEPERRPGWQLRKKRSKRRPLSALATANSSSAPKAATGKQQLAKGPNSGVEYYTSLENRSPVPSSARSSPVSLIDRIGSSIVANLTNLASGFPSTGAVQMQTRDAIDEKPATLVNRSNSELNQLARRRLSKAQLDRQNDCARMANSNRRADRRLKMHSVQNGCSVNRKVHTSFH